MSSGPDSLRSTKTANPSAHRAVRHEDPLSAHEMAAAVPALHDTSNLNLYRQVDRSYVDPAVPNQRFSLVSFTPAQDAVPDQNGFYGMMKVRGTFATSEEAEVFAEDIIKNVDSTHPILTVFTGRPFPIIASTKKAEVAAQVDIREVDMSEADSGNKILEVQRDMAKQTDKMMREEVQKREELLKVEEPQKTPMETYTTLRVKRGQLLFNIITMRKQIEQLQAACIETHTEMKKMETDDPVLMKAYLDAYNEARGAITAPMDASNEAFVQLMKDDRDVEAIIATHS